MARIMVIAGTADARELISELLKHGTEVLATVATGYGRELLDTHPKLEVNTGKLNSPEMKTLISDRRIDCIVDASHPFAREVSVNAIEAGNEEGIPYIRFERACLNTEVDNIIRVKDFEAASYEASKIAGNIFLTIGTNNLKYFKEKLPDFSKRVFARILPDSRMILKCEEAGLTAGNIMAIKGPFSVEMNLEMLKHCNASAIVTKESGETGGTEEKLRAAAIMGIPVILIERPEIDYGTKVSSVEEVLKLVEGIVK
ncbi:MAG: cobalt-precorrin-6A reductase [Clostridia bacterium]|nr:cobalt-precorrin-6A reductase [Clostridia bacterium]